MVIARRPSAGQAFLGMDLGWTTGGTGLALVSDDGGLIASTRLQTDDEIVGWIDLQQSAVVVAAVDAPLIVGNETGQREAERLIGKAFGAFGASAHVTNQRKFGGAMPRAAVLADRLGWRTDPSSGPGTPASPLCIEVYPHPAMVGLFALGYRLDYKKGDRARRVAGMTQLLNHVASISEMRLAESTRWSEITAAVANPGPGQLDRLEDEVDAIVCAHLAWLWHHRPETLRVYGSVREGYIIAPPAPAHRPIPPARVARDAPGVARTVAGRPTGYAGEEHERIWKNAVRAAFSDAASPAAGRVAVELEFVLGPDQAGRNEPDLDNLIKATIDALEGVLGVRTGTGTRLEADDVRVDRIVASKRIGEPSEVGARISVRPLGT